MTGLRVGLLGAGMVAEYHIEGWRRCPDARIVGVADPDRVRATARAAEAGVEAFRSLSEMRQACALDAVDIVAPPAAHAALIDEAIAAGFHVQCQKPLAPSYDEAHAIVSKLPPAPRVMLHENWRWRAPYRALKAGLLSGEIARPDNFAMRVESAGLIAQPDGTYPALERQAFFSTLDRFVVIEVLVHHLDVLSFLLGPIEIRSAELRRRCAAIRGEDYAHIELTAGGIPGTLTGDFCLPAAQGRPSDNLTFEGRESVQMREWTLTKEGRQLCAVDPTEGYLGSYASAIAHFAKALAKDAPFETPASRGLELLNLVEAVYAKAGTVKEVGHG